MKFNEKLIELRRKAGLSQEDLGYKLNVTRQTVSKWELGQTTPEMDKLIEMSKIFNISVDELINENKTETQNIQTTQIEDQPIIDKEDSKKEKNMKFIIIGILVVVIILIVVKIATALPNKTSNAGDQVTNSQTSMIERIIDKIFNRIDDMQQNNNEEVENIFNEGYNKIEKEYNQISIQQQNKQEASNFNFYLENSNGTKNGFLVKSTLDEVITSNKTKDRKITVKYNEIETQDPEIIKQTKQKIENSKNYEVSIDYDEEGFINKVIIEDL